MAHAHGSWYLAPSTDRADEYAAGYDANTFATEAEALAAIPALRQCGEDFDATDWVAVQRPKIEVTRYMQDGTTYICAGDRSTDEDDARTAAEAELRSGESLADDMGRVDGCCTWTVVRGEA